MNYVSEPRLADEVLLDDLAKDLYATSDRKFTPVYPWIFVRVLPKEQMHNGIVLPGFDQNKTVHEGIVLATWKPITHRPLPRKTDTGGDEAREDYTALQPTRYEELDRPKESELKPGDHVLFPFWAGMPIDGVKDTRYRVVKECDWLYKDEGGIFATVEYAEKDERIQAKLADLVEMAAASFTTDMISEQRAKAGMIKAFNDAFVLVERDGYAVTTSGR